MITRYEEKTDELFICINSDTKPVYLEHFFTEEERATELTRKATIEKLMGELKVKEDEYVEPEQALLKVEEARAFQLDSKKITDAKTAFMSKRLADKAETIIEEKIEMNVAGNVDLAPKQDDVKQQIPVKK